MSLERKDIRGKLDPAVHAKFAAIAAVKGRDMGDIVEQLVAAYVEKEVHDAIELATAIERLGISGKNRSGPGTAGNRG